jgi:hypothetical protein
MAASVSAGRLSFLLGSVCGVHYGRPRIASKEVLIELDRKVDDLYAWIKQREEMFLEIDDELQASVSDIMTKYPKLVDERTTKSLADPWVCGLASVKRLAVVTEEKGGSAEKPRIPFVCQAESIRCLNLLEFIRELGWRI